MNHCKTCKHWKVFSKGYHKRPDRFGACVSPQMDSELKPESSLISAHDDSLPLSVSENFGCVEHESLATKAFHVFLEVVVDGDDDMTPQQAAAKAIRVASVQAHDYCQVKTDVDGEIVADEMVSVAEKTFLVQYTRIDSWPEPVTRKTRRDTIESLVVRESETRVTRGGKRIYRMVTGHGTSVDLVCQEVPHAVHA